MATVKGQNLRIFVGNGDATAIAAALTCTLEIQMNVQEKSTKDDEGGWARHHVASLNWNVKVNGAVTIDPDRNDPASLMDRIGQQVYVKLALASGDLNSDMGDMILFWTTSARRRTHGGWDDRGRWRRSSNGATTVGRIMGH